MAACTSLDDRPHPLHALATYRGLWRDDERYKPGDVVLSNADGALWICGLRVGDWLRLDSQVFSADQHPLS